MARVINSSQLGGLSIVQAGIDIFGFALTGGAANASFKKTVGIMAADFFTPEALNFASKKFGLDNDQATALAYSMVKLAVLGQTKQLESLKDVLLECSNMNIKGYDLIRKLSEEYNINLSDLPKDYKEAAKKALKN